MNGPVRIAVLASGGGTNLQALLDTFNATRSAIARVALVVSDRAEAGALERAAAIDVPTSIVDMKGREPGAAARDLLGAFEQQDIELVALAGFLRLVPAPVVARFRDRIINVHPALLPAFGGSGFYGARVHRAVLEAGCRVSGPTVHLVDEEYDRGRIIAQWPVPVLPDDVPDTLAARVLRAEHVLFPAAVEMLARKVRQGGATASGGAVAPDGDVGVPGSDASAPRAPAAAFQPAILDAPERAAVRAMLDLPPDAES